MNMRELLIVDVETSGLDPRTDHVVEVGAVLWSVPHRATIAAASGLVYHPLGNAAEHINGVPSALVACPAHTNTLRGALAAVVGRACSGGMVPGAIVAHNAAFDRRWLTPEDTQDIWPSDVPWICSQDDIDWPRPSEARGLVALALAHGVAVVSAHRALADCETLARLLERAAELTNIDEMLERAMRPKAWHRAMVSYADNHLAKQAGFRWDSDKRIWKRKLVADDVPAMNLPFDVIEIGG